MPCGSLTGYPFKANCQGTAGFWPSFLALAALRMKTVDAAYVLGLDALVGSIEPGKLADFTVLSASPLDVPVAELRGVRVLGTVLGAFKPGGGDASGR